jgi:hypothetical protein
MSNYMNARIRKFIFLLTGSFYLTNSFSQIPGCFGANAEVQVFPEQNYCYQYGNQNDQAIWKCTVFGQINPNVTIGGVGNVGILKVKKTETHCQLLLTVATTDNPNATTDMWLTILPWITGPSIVYVGETVTFGIQDNCPHSGCLYLWNIAPQTVVCNPCNALGNNNSVSVYIDPNAIPSVLTVNCTMSGCMSSKALIPLDYQVKLKKPNVSGPTSIGCGETLTSNEFKYKILPSIVGATSYNWEVPSFLTIISGQGQNEITVIENSVGEGDIKVQAIVGNGSTVTSDITNYHVKVCCVSKRTIIADVVSGNDDKQEVGIEIVATNIIYPSGSAKYHAGYQLKLEPGFTASAGSYFHGYIQSCSGNFYRINGNLNETDSSRAINDSNTSIDLNDYSLGMSTHQSEILENAKAINGNLLIYPNPSKGEFKLKLPNREYPNTIVILDVFGRDIYKEENLSNYEYNINIKEIPDGIYFIKVNYLDETITKKIIKN